MRKTASSEWWRGHSFTLGYNNVEGSRGAGIQCDFAGIFTRPDDFGYRREQIYSSSGSQRKKEVLVLKGHEFGVCCIGWSSCGQWIASGSSDCTLRLWRIQSEGTEIAPWSIECLKDQSSVWPGVRLDVCNGKRRFLGQCLAGG